ncbi:ABC transporter ATP-binding protein [Oceanirhabdus sp. W0125-5]|uniref:ABC transporter ATP-binding protein n=1 Tax=Oceanirhabdus sp. W0125-5 TaxID=2999116 RepID=UPI0022F2A89D|nr:ABC transporter ATP-binding protein [Oceanirhabdus sp. W0125-5]WBW98590.1 ABC transporter ATP-binding protein [Oceanirhabdus sp. W0125-5]
MQMLKTHNKAFKIMKRFHYLDHSIGPLIILLGIVRGVVPFIPIVFSKYILSSVIDKQYKEALYYSIAMSLLFCGGCIISEWIKKIVTDKNSELSRKIEDIIHQKPLGLDYESIEDGKVIGSYTSAISALKYKGSYQQLVSKYSELLQSIVSFLVAIGLTLQLCVSVSISEYKILNMVTNPVVCVALILVVILGMMGVTGKAVKWSQNKISELFEVKLDSERRFAYLCRMFRDEEMIKTIQAYEAGKSISNLLKDTSKHIKENYKNEGKYWICENVIKASSGGIIVVLAYSLVAVKVLAGAIGIGAFLKYSQAVIKMNESLLAVIVFNHEIGDIMRYMDKLTEFLDMENKFETGSIPVEKRSDHQYKICFEDVWFKYPGSDEYVLKGVSCEINSNQKSALVGPNGAGKSTFIKLLSRLYEPTKGRITLNGVDIKKYDYKEYLSLFSVVFQDFGLFSFSLGENISSSVELQKKKVKECLTKTGLEKYEDRLDEGLNEMSGLEAYVGRDSSSSEKYSGGEQQKIAIARALYKDGAFVILDEPTAALDPISEYEIYQNFDSLVGNKTCIYISHRMSSCRFCSDIIVLNDGNIVERGNHEQLIKDEKLYCDMWNAQAKYYTAS